jgi:prevent-host-death family protein
MTVSVRELKAHLSKYLGKAAAGAEIVVTSRGKKVARLAPIARAQTPEEAEDAAIARLNALPWIGPSNGKKVRGSDRPIKWKPGQKLLSDMIVEDRG